MNRRRILALTGTAAALAASASILTRRARAALYRVTRTDAEWRSQLSPAAYAVLRHADTEPPFSSPLDHEFAAGRYDCAGCASHLFTSATKFDSGTGWPSFYAPIEGAVATDQDDTIGMVRTEVHCATCGGHLGHVFDDGPRPTGLRYCMNGVALTFHKTEA